MQGFGEQDIVQISCTGTLIAPDVVLTAAHCLDPTLLTMGFGDVSRVKYWVSSDADLSSLAGEMGTIPTGAIDAVDYFAHPAFNITSMNNVDGPGDFSDIGLIFLSQIKIPRKVPFPPMLITLSPPPSDWKSYIEKMYRTEKNLKNLK